MFTRDVDDYLLLRRPRRRYLPLEERERLDDGSRECPRRYAELETVTVYGVAIAQQEGRAGMATVVMQAGTNASIPSLLQNWPQSICPAMRYRYSYA